MRDASLTTIRRILNFAQRATASRDHERDLPAAPVDTYKTTGKKAKVLNPQAHRLKALAKISTDGGIWIEGVHHAEISVKDLREGDLCFYFKWGHKTALQRTIIFAQTFHNLLQRPFRKVLGSENCCHCGVIVGLEPDRGQFDFSEMSRHTDGGAVTTLDFSLPCSEEESNLDFHNYYLFYRIKDPAVASHLAQIARQIGESAIPYSLNGARFSWLRLPAVLYSGNRRLEQAGEYALGNLSAARPMFCSEMVAAAGAAAVAAARKEQEAGGLGRATHSLRKAPERDLFYRDPAATLPSHLHGALMRSTSSEVIGYMLPTPPVVEVQASPTQQKAIDD